MEQKDFNKVVEESCITIRNLASKKGKEYALGKDRLDAFKRTAELMRSTPEVALLGMVNKHYTSVLDMVDNVKVAKFSDKIWAEKIDDIIVYMICLKALTRERNSAENV